MNECNAIQMQNYTIVQNASAVQLVNINREHNYVEMYDNSSNQIQIVKEIDNKVFQFSSYEYDFNQFTLEYLGVVEDYDFEFNMDNVLHCTFSTTGGNIYNDGGGVFVIEAYFKDFLDYNSKNSLYELYLSLGLNSDTLLKSPIYVTYIFEDNSVTISISANIYLEVKNSSIYQIFLESTSTYLFEEFEMFDENDPQYTVQAPSSYEEILHETDILKDGIALENYVRDDGMYLKCYLEHGQYYLIEPHSAFTSVGLMEIFDEDVNLVNHYPQELYKKYGSSYLRQAFYIPEDGYYYMRLNSDPAGYEHRYNVVKVDYETSPFDLIEDTPDEMTGNIEGFGDVDFYTYTNTTNENKVIRITNNADSNVCVIARRYDENYMTNDIPANSSAYFLVTPGENKFYITHEYVRFDDDDVISKIPYSYDMSITEMNYNYGVGADGNDLEYVTTEFNEDYLMVGYGFPSSYMLLEVNEHGYYTFVEDFVDENMYYCQVVLYDSNGNRVMNDGSLRFKLNPGVYTVAIVNNEHVIDILRIKYEFQPIAN